MRSDYLLRLVAYAGLAFLHLPLVFIALYAFNGNESGYTFPLSDLTLRWFVRAWERKDIQEACGGGCASRPSASIQDWCGLT